MEASRRLKSLAEGHVALISSAVLCLQLILIGCHTTHSVATSFQHVEPGAKMAIIAFRDCTITKQEDCSGSGNITSSVLASVISSSGRYSVIPLSRPGGPKAEVSDEQAVDLAKSRGFAYVINGEVNNFYRVAPMTFRKDKLSCSIRVLRTYDGSVVTTAMESSESHTNLATPEGMVERIANKLLKAL
jgi:hypothetical protein